MAALRKKISRMFVYSEDTQTSSQSNGPDAVRGFSLDSGFHSMPKSVQCDISPRKIQKAASTTLSNMFSLAAISEALRSKTASFHTDKENVGDTKGGQDQVQTPKKQSRRSARLSATLSRSSGRLRRSMSSHRGRRVDEWSAGSPTTPVVLAKEIPPAIDVNIPSSFLNDQAKEEPSLSENMEEPSAKLHVAPRILWPQATRVAMSEGSPEKQPAGPHLSSTLGSPHIDSFLVERNKSFSMIPFSKDASENPHPPRECQCPKCGVKSQKSDELRAQFANCRNDDVPPELAIENETRCERIITGVGSPTNDQENNLRTLPYQYCGEMLSDELAVKMHVHSKCLTQANCPMSDGMNRRQRVQSNFEHPVSDGFSPAILHSPISLASGSAISTKAPFDSNTDLGPANSVRSPDIVLETQPQNKAVEASEPERTSSSKAAFAKEAFTRLNTSEATIHEIKQPKTSYRPPTQRTTSVKTGLRDLPASNSFISQSKFEHQLELVASEIYEADAEKSPLNPEASSMGSRSSWEHTRAERNKRYLALPKYDEETRSDDGSDLGLECSDSSISNPIEAISANIGAAEPGKGVPKGDFHHDIEAIERVSGSNLTEPLTASDDSSIEMRRRASGKACGPPEAELLCSPKSKSRLEFDVDPRVDLTVPDLSRDEFRDPVQESFDNFHASFRVIHDNRKPRISFKELKGIQGMPLRNSDVAGLSPQNLPVPASDDPYEAAIKAAGLSVEPHMRSSSAFSDSTASSCAVTTHSRLGSSPPPHLYFHIRSGPARTTSDIIESLNGGDISSLTLSCLDENAPPSVAQTHNHAKRMDDGEVDLEDPQEDVDHYKEPSAMVVPPKPEITVPFPSDRDVAAEQAQEIPRTNREFLGELANNLKSSTNDEGLKPKSKPRFLLSHFEPAHGHVTTYPKPSPETKSCIGGGRNGVCFRDDTDIIGYQVPQGQAHALATPASHRAESTGVHEPFEVGERSPEMGSKVGLNKHLADLHMRFIYSLEEDGHEHNDIDKDGTSVETQSFD